MKNKLIFLFTFVLMLHTFPQSARADVIFSGTKGIDWCYQISNTPSYPNYSFILYGHLLAPQIIKEGDCLHFYKFGLGEIYAIRKTDFKETQVLEEFSKAGESGDEFFKINESKLIKSNIQLKAFAPVQENDPLQKVVITLDIKSLNKDTFNIQKSKINYTYTDGTTEEKVFQTQGVVPAASRRAIVPWWFAKFWYIILPILALIVIGTILLGRSKK